MTLYRINEWERWYEVSDSKKVDGPLSWVAVRTKQDGFGFRRMAADRRACELLSAWVLMVQIAAKQPRKDRGKLVRDGRPLTAKGLAMMTGFPEAAFDYALEFFCDPEQGWLVREDSPSRPACSAASAKPEDAPDATPPTAAASTTIRTGPDASGSSGSTGQDRTIQKETTSPRPPPAPPTPDGERFVDWFVALLTETGATPKITPSVRENWADCYDRLIRLDGRTKDQVKAVCRWARNDPFWQRNFLSPMKLREKKHGITYFDTFLARMAEAGDGPFGARPPGASARNPFALVDTSKTAGESPPPAPTT